MSSSNTGAAPARETWGDVVKGVLILCVVLWHVIMKSYLQIDWRLGVPVPGLWGLFGDAVWPFLMPLFVLVSGYFAANALTRPWRVVARTRIARFFYLYLLWSLIHMAAMWAFPDFPTLIPRTVAEVIEFLTISPPNTWYLYALALYFLVAKALRRIPPGVPLGAAAVVSILVSAGYIDIVSNRGSLLYNLTFFLLGVYLAPRIRGFASSVTPATTVLATAGYVIAFAVMRLTGTESLPGIWLLVSLAGVTMGLAAAPAVARIPHVGQALAWLGRRSLPVYVIHMPLVAMADYALYEALSGARIAVQLVAAVALPVVLTTVVVTICLVLHRLLARDGLSWLFDLPQRLMPRPQKARPVTTAAPSAPWRVGIAVVLLVVCGVGATRANAIPGCPAALPSQPARVPGQVSIGGAGDVLIHDVGHTVPDDGGAGYFADVEHWFTQDLVTANLEQVISEDTGHVKCDPGGDCLAFRSAPGTAQYFTGFDLLNLANNHTSDFGPAGYANTQAHLAAHDVRTVGARNEIACTNIGGTTVAVIGFAPYANTNRLTDLRHVKNLVASAAQSADLVVVHAHMGAEGPDANVVRPGPERMYGEDRGDVVAFSHAAVDAGADLVLGHGPHTLRGMEFYRGRLIAYSLGNFGGGGVFGADEATRYGIYLDVTLHSDGRFGQGRLHALHFEHDGGRPVPDPDARATELVDEFSQRDFPATAPQIDADGTLAPPR
ncbi:MAG TPA: CapA family protein [Actinotalea caeni]|uniref:CapA family protein n=1 Tax=Actinotalea caeni TaxID=1348467 RepID=UPI002B4AE133|nr:CapA family protein [Actinotalea caeni]HLV56509.1 CapA family protein [Actinotalea caeni]